MKIFKNCSLKKYSLILMLGLPAILLAQENAESTPAKPAKEYVRSTFENAVLINNQTVMVNNHKSLDFMIQHRFGEIKNEKDLFGIYAPANIRLGLSYGITKRITIGLGVTKHKMLYDFQGKVNILKQTKGSGSPVSLVYFGDVARSAQDKDNFLNQENEFKGANKLSYFHELIIGRKLTSKISMQIAGTYSHQNIIDSVYGQHDFYGASFAGRYKFSPQSSFILDFDYLLNVSGIEKDFRPMPNLGIGYELSTGSHQFQVFVGTAKDIIDQEFRVFNVNDIAKPDLVVGFNITRQWGFK